MSITPKNENERTLLAYLDKHKETLFETLSSLVPRTSIRTEMKMRDKTV